MISFAFAPARTIVASAFKSPVTEANLYTSSKFETYDLANVIVFAIN